jgi:hypothetical protein
VVSDFLGRVTPAPGIKRKMRDFVPVRTLLKEVSRCWRHSRQQLTWARLKRAGILRFALNDTSN